MQREYYPILETVGRARMSCRILSHLHIVSKFRGEANVRLLRLKS